MAKTTIEEFIGTGRRKTSVARVRLTRGTGKLIVNRRSLDQHIPVPELRTQALEPLTATHTTDQYDITISVEGGGIAGQAGAIRLGIARALLRASADLKPTLRDKGFLTRDPRMRERKKYGQPGARKRFQFSKR